MIKEEAIQKHRDMWNWISQQTKKRKHKVSKLDYFNENRRSTEKIPYCFCYCCDYAHGQCGKCPVVWPNKSACIDTLYSDWCNCKFNWRKAACLAKKIACLPVRKTTYTVLFGTEVNDSDELLNKATLKQANKFIAKDAKKRLQHKTPYIRVWEINDKHTLCYDYGSWSHFYFLMPEN